jgi:hypothetical protein
VLFFQTWRNELKKDRQKIPKNFAAWALPFCIAGSAP